jgi:hypothetical protein
MGKLELAGSNLGRVFNFRYGYTFAQSVSFSRAKLPNLKWKTHPRQLLSFLLLAFALPATNQCQRLLLA